MSPAYREWFRVGDEVADVIGPEPASRRAEAHAMWERASTALTEAQRVPQVRHADPRDLVLAVTVARHAQALAPAFVGDQLRTAALQHRAEVSRAAHISEDLRETQARHDRTPRLRGREQREQLAERMAGHREQLATAGTLARLSQEKVAALTPDHQAWTRWQQEFDDARRTARLAEQEIRNRAARNPDQPARNRPDHDEREGHTAPDPQTMEATMTTVDDRNAVPPEVADPEVAAPKVVAPEVPPAPATAVDAPTVLDWADETGSTRYFLPYGERASELASEVAFYLQPAGGAPEVAPTAEGFGQVLAARHEGDPGWVLQPLTEQTAVDVPLLGSHLSVATLPADDADGGDRVWRVYAATGPAAEALEHGQDQPDAASARVVLDVTDLAQLHLAAAEAARAEAAQLSRQQLGDSPGLEAERVQALLALATLHDVASTRTAPETTVTVDAGERTGEVAAVIDANVAALAAQQQAKAVEPAPGVDRPGEVDRMPDTEQTRVLAEELNQEFDGYEPPYGLSGYEETYGVSDRNAPWPQQERETAAAEAQLRAGQAARAAEAAAAMAATTPEQVETMHRLALSAAALTAMKDAAAERAEARKARSGPDTEADTEERTGKRAPRAGRGARDDAPQSPARDNRGQEDREAARRRESERQEQQYRDAAQRDLDNDRDQGRGR